jgi:indolepyruvate ferredoxin oxidoreductase alpha subunit
MAPGEQQLTVDEKRCNLCGLCLDIGCPALAPGETAVEVSAACHGCGVCAAVCKRGALSVAGEPAGKP